jgi:ribosomal protein S18 acetylase RimI-like enzyme
LTFRKATLDDIEEVVQLVARADRQSAAWAPFGEPHGTSIEGDRRRLSQRIPDPRNHSEVAEEEGRMAGFVNVQPRGADAHVSYLFVDPEFQGRGVGAQLLERGMAAATARGFTHATLVAAVRNAGARRFYERNGWVATGRVVFNEEIGLDMAEYERDLA